MSKHDSGQVAASAAEVYEQFFVPALFGEWPAHLLRAAEVQAGDRLLDVACGTGVLAREGVHWVGDEGEVVGVDINAGMLEVARQKAPLITWKRGLAEKLPFASASFDRVASQFGLMFFEDQVQALAEMARVLRPGGRLVVAVWGSLAETPGYAAVAQLLEELFGPEVARSIEMPYSLGDCKRLGALFAEAGLEEITIETVTGTARFDSIDAWMYTDIKGWTLADVIDDEDFERFRQQARGRLTPFMGEDGRVKFQAPAHIVSSWVL